MADIDLLLVGRSGNGKSSTGNSILGKRFFDPRSTGGSGVGELKKESGRIDGRTVNVVDGISLGHLEATNTNSVNAVIDQSKTAVSMCPSGINAFLIHLKYGIRFTQQEYDAVKSIKSIFGDDVIKRFGIVVLSYGDSFDLDTEDEEITFDKWCKDQTGNVRDLFTECNRRIVLFNNRTKDSAYLVRQNRTLISKVAEIKEKYTMDHFIKAEMGRNKMVVEAKLPQLQQKTTEFVDKITRSLRKIDDNYFTANDKLQELNSLNLQLQNFKDWLYHEDKGAHSISQLLLQISITENTIQTKLKKVNLSEQLNDQKRQQENGHQAKLNKTAVYIVWLIVFLVLVWFILPMIWDFGKGTLYTNPETQRRNVNHGRV